MLFAHYLQLLICRICHEATGELITPCRCKGTAQYVHRQCLNDWRKIKKKRYRSKAYHCEICLTPFRLLLVYPSFLSYVKNHWTLFEKLMYSSSLISCLFSVGVSFNAYERDKVKRRSNVNILSKNIEKAREIQHQKGVVEIVYKGVEVIRTLPESFLYGWPTRIKFVMLVCMVVVMLGNAFLFRQWRERTREEVVLPYEGDKLDSLD
jgi:hypothetical protein